MSSRSRVVGAGALALALATGIIGLAQVAPGDRRFGDASGLPPIWADPSWAGLGATAGAPVDALLRRLDGSILATLDVRAARSALGLRRDASPTTGAGSESSRRLRLAVSVLLSYLPPRNDDPVANTVDLRRVRAIATSYASERPFPRVMLLATTQSTAEIARALQRGGYDLRGGVLERRGPDDDGPVRYVAFGPKVVALAYDRGDLERALGPPVPESRLAATLRRLPGPLRIGRRFPDFCVPNVAFSEEIGRLRGTLSLTGATIQRRRIVFGDRRATAEPGGTDRIHVRRVTPRRTGYAVDYDFGRVGYRHTPAPLVLLEPPAGVLMYRCPGGT